VGEEWSIVADSYSFIATTMTTTPISYYTLSSDNASQNLAQLSGQSYFAARLHLAGRIWLFL